MRRLLTAAIVVFVCSGPAGCAKQEFFKVVGEVTLDGQPVQEGDIAFYPENPHHGSDAAKIVNGRYEMLTRPGKKRVDVRAARLSKTEKNSFGAAMSENYIPARYNTATELTADVRASDDNRIDFTLTGGK